MATQSGVGAGPNTVNRHGFEDRVTKALAGVNQYLPAATNLVLNGKSMAQPEIVKALQDVLQLFSDLRSTRATAQAQLKTVRTELIPGHALYTALEKAVQAFLGKGNPMLAQFGYALGNRKPRTGATNVKAQAKSQLTRALRHTMGPKQKASIQAVAPAAVTVALDGTVQAVFPAPVESATGGSEIVQPTRSAAGIATPVSPGDPAGAGSAQGAAK
jgi:hypothetical protein